MAFDPLLRAIETPFRCAVSIFGKVVAMESNDAAMEARFREVFGHFPPAKAKRPALRLRLLLDREIEDRPPWPPPLHRSFEDLLVITCGGNVAVAELRKRYAIGCFSPAMVADPEFLHWRFYGLIFMMLQRHYFTPVHASCVVRLGRGLCLCGDSNAGKTSLAYYLGRRGWPVLAQDAVWVSRGRRLRLHGDAHYLHFTPQASKLFPELVQWPVNLIRNGQECVAVGAQELGIPLAGGPCLPGPIVFLDRGGEKGLERVGAREALDRLSSGMYVDDEGVMKSHRNAYRRLAGAGAWRMGYETLEEAWEFLGKI